MRPTSDRQRSIRSLTAALTLFLASALAQAGVNQWTGGKPAGSLDLSSSIVASDPSNPYVVYSALLRDLYRSADGGRTWARIGSFGNISALLVHPTVPSTIYLGVDGYDGYSGVLKSADSGQTWRKTQIPEAVSALSASPAGSTLYAVTLGGSAYKSEDGGDSWRATTRVSARHLLTIRTLVIDPTDDATVYAGGEEWSTSYYYPIVAPVLSKSRNGGATWSDLSVAVSTGPASVRAIAIDPANPSRLYVGLQGAASQERRLLRSMDAGASWDPAVNGLTLAADILSLAVDPRNPSTLYAGTNNGVYRTRDGGTSWSPFSQQLARSLNSVASLDVGRGGRLLHAATPQGIFDREVGSGLLDVSSGQAGQSRVLSWNADRLAVQSVDPSGRWNSSPPEGPYSAWDATAIADGADGLSRVLWQSGDGRVGLEISGSTGSRAAFDFAMEPGWTAVDVSVSNDGRTDLLWISIDGLLRITSVDSSGRVSEGRTHQPGEGCPARAIADAPDGASWVLWRCTDGTAGMDRWRDAKLETSFRISVANPGWGVEDLAVGADGVPRVLWTNPDGRMGIASVDSQGLLFDRRTHSSPGQQARRISGSPDGDTRVLWTTADGSGSLWTLYPDNSVLSPHPTPGAETDGPAAGQWTGTYVPVSNPWDYSECRSQSAAARFAQSGSTVTGTIASSGACGFSVVFNGTLEGASLIGTITGQGFYDGSTARGSLSGTSIDLTLTDPSAAAGGQLHLQRQ